MTACTCSNEAAAAGESRSIRGRPSTPLPPRASPSPQRPLSNQASPAVARAPHPAPAPCSTPQPLRSPSLHPLLNLLRMPCLSLSSHNALIHCLFAPPITPPRSPLYPPSHRSLFCPHPALFYPSAHMDALPIPNAIRFLLRHLCMPLLPWPSSLLGCSVPWPARPVRPLCPFAWLLALRAPYPANRQPIPTHHVRSDAPLYTIHRSRPHSAQPPTHAPFLPARTPPHRSLSCHAGRIRLQLPPHPAQVGIPQLGPVGGEGEGALVCQKKMRAGRAHAVLVRGTHALKQN